MSGPTHSWDQPEDPRESTINLPRIIEGSAEQQEASAESRSDLASWQGRTIRPPAADSRRPAPTNRLDSPDWRRSDPTSAANGDTGLYRMRPANGDRSSFFDPPARSSPEQNGSADHAADYLTAGPQADQASHQAEQFSAWRQPSNGAGQGGSTPFRQPADAGPPAEVRPGADRRQSDDSWQPPGGPAQPEVAARPLQPDPAAPAPQPAADQQRDQPDAGAARRTDAAAAAPWTAVAEQAPRDNSPADLPPVTAARDMAPAIAAPPAGIRPETSSPEAADYRTGELDHSQRPPRGSLADLRRRLLLLPDGHPSSHFEDGGARKPPPPRVRHFELPLTEDERDAEQPVTTGAASANGSHRPGDVADQPADLTAEPAAGASTATAVVAAAPAAEGRRPAPSQHPGSASTSEYARPDWTGGERRRSNGSAESARSLPGGPADSMRPDPAVAPDRAARNGSAVQDTAIISRPADHADQPAISSRLTPQQERIADQMLAECRTAEGRRQTGGYGESGLTPAIMRVAGQLSHGGLAPGSEREALKSAERFKQKLARLIARHPDTPVDQLAAEICDSIRYAFVIEPEHYVDGTWQVHRRLSTSGFELEARRNRWESPESKGIKTRWRDPAHDVVFEVQFHTPASWDVQQQTHAAYLRITDPATLPAERATLRARQVAAATAAKPPPGWTEIADFRADIR